MQHVTAAEARTRLPALLDAAMSGEHVRITRRGDRTEGSVLVPYEWYAEANRALPLTRGLTHLGTGSNDINSFIANLTSAMLRMPLVTAAEARTRLPALLDAATSGEHVRITRRGDRTEGSVLVPYEWYAEADRALALARGLAQLETGSDDVNAFIANLPSAIASRHQGGTAPQELARAS